MHRPAVDQRLPQAARRVQNQPLITAVYRKVFDRGRLELPVIEAETLAPESGAIQLPVFIRCWRARTRRCWTWFFF